MSSRLILLAAILFAPIRAEGQLLKAPASPNQIVLDATNALAQSAAMPSGLPEKMLEDAAGIAIIPNVVRGAFVIGVQRGHGVLLERSPDRTWQAPKMIEISGGSLGYQVGVQSTDLILVFRTPQSVANVMRGTLKVGVDASAAAGPVGRQASAATDVPLQSEILSYSRARGAFVGASIDGSSISYDQATDAIYYNPPGTIPASATQLVQLVSKLSGGGQPVAASPVQPVAMNPQTSAPISLETTRQQLDTSSRQLAAVLDDQWKTYLALPPEVYVPNQSPSVESIDQAIARYETVAAHPQYAVLRDQPTFQATLKCLQRMSEVQKSNRR